MSEERGSTGLGTVILAGAIGAAVGAVVALLLAPRPGKETRAEWGEKARELVTKAKEKVEEVSTTVRHDDRPAETAAAGEGTQDTDAA